MQREFLKFYASLTFKEEFLKFYAYLAFKEYFQTLLHEKIRVYLKVFIFKVFFLKVFLKESLIKCFSRKHTTSDFLDF